MQILSRYKNEWMVWWWYRNVFHLKARQGRRYNTEARPRSYYRDRGNAKAVTTGLRQDQGEAFFAVCLDEIKIILKCRGRGITCAASRLLKAKILRRDIHLLYASIFCHSPVPFTSIHQGVGLRMTGWPVECSNWKKEVEKVIVKIIIILLIASTDLVNVTYSLLEGLTPSSLWRKSAQLFWCQVSSVLG